MAILTGFALEYLLVVLLGALILPMVYALGRGPTTADRALALEVIGTLCILMLLLLSTILGRSIYLDVALLLTIFSFLGTLIISRYLERGLLK